MHPLSLYNCLSPLCNGVCVLVFVYWYLCLLPERKEKSTTLPKECDAGEVHLTTEDEARVAMFVVPHTLNVEYGFRYVGVMLIIGVTKVPHIVAISRDE